eukprot:scaffold2205_cov183-Ochromonas_danica.AAC.3
MSHNNSKSNEKEESRNLSSTRTASKTCMLCFEPGGVRRSCCRATFCDHCYVKNQKCPNCKTQTKQEKLTGATYQLKVFSEHEECRVCLDPGLLRRCCGNYYCDNCYYSAPLCRSCGTPVTTLEYEQKSVFADRAYCITVLIGWAVTIFVTIVVTAFVAVVIAADVTTPVGINQYHCYGFFRTCDISVCVETTEAVAEGSAPLQAISSWNRCNLSSLYKLESKACIFDPNLYHQSQREMGYDICDDEFNEGVYVFEDTFENWKAITSPSSSIMLSAHWANVTNGQTDSACGAFEGKRSLRFGGDDERMAITDALDVSGGGRLEAELFLPPIGYDAFNNLCKTGYIGVVNFEYSVDNGLNWIVLKSFDPAIYRQQRFFAVGIDLPEAAVTNQTRFRFNQPVFEAARDNWALDNVRVLRRLPSDWQTTSAFKSNRRFGRNTMQFAQCCADTDWCAKRLSEDDKAACKRQFHWFDGNKYLFRLSEIFTCLTLLLLLIRSIYLIVFDYLVREKLPFHDDLVLLFDQPWFRQSLGRLLPRNLFLMLLPNRITLPPRQSEIMAIHRAARLEEKLRKDFEDEAGDGAMMISAEQAQEEERARLKKIDKAKRKLAKRMGKKNFKASTIVVEEEKKSEEEEIRAEVLPFDDPQAPRLTPQEEVEARATAINENDLKFSQDALLSEADKLRRQNLALLRVPFTVESQTIWTYSFSLSLLVVFMVLLIIELTRMPNYSIYEPFIAFGYLPATFYVNSYVILFFAACCDLKEMLLLVRYCVPPFVNWQPLVTLDLSDDQRSLFVGDQRVPLNQIREVLAFPASLSYWLAAGVVAGGFPWCLFALVLRETELHYGSMRFVTPLLGCVMLLRAALGPMLWVKAVWGAHYFFATSFQMREAIGQAMQERPTWILGLNAALGLTALAAFFTALVDVQWLWVVVLAALGGGAVLGLLTGTGHLLPIKPWLCKYLLLVHPAFLINPFLIGSSFPDRFDVTA